MYRSPEPVVEVHRTLSGFFEVLGLRVSVLAAARVRPRARDRRGEMIRWRGAALVDGPVAVGVRPDRVRRRLARRCRGADASSDPADASTGDGPSSACAQGAGELANPVGPWRSVAMHGVPEAVHARGDDGRSAGNLRGLAFGGARCPSGGARPECPRAHPRRVEPAGRRRRATLAGLARCGIVVEEQAPYCLAQLRR